MPSSSTVTASSRRPHLDETVFLGGVEIPAGQVELVATDVEYEGRGLVRALMGWAHERSAERGQLVEVMIGIPYFYRLFAAVLAVAAGPRREYDLGRRAWRRGRRHWSHHAAGRGRHAR
ncbi:MAG: GNAT family N-acetyltransferase [Jiangellaceae bacterium]